jgi:hypothetical protein
VSRLSYSCAACSRRPAGPGDGLLLVIDGEGLENLPEQMPTPKGAYRVYRVNTELGLRHLLWKAKGAPLIAVMPEEVARSIQKAPDLLRRARNQRVHALSVNDVLEVVLGVRVVGADAPHMQQLALEHIGKLGLAMSHRTLPTVVDRKLLTEMLVDVSVGEKVRTQTPGPALAAWVQEPPRWSANVSKLVRDALPRCTATKAGCSPGRSASPNARLRELVTHGAVLTVEAPEAAEASVGPAVEGGRRGPTRDGPTDPPAGRRAPRRGDAGCWVMLAASCCSRADRVGRES